MDLNIHSPLPKKKDFRIGILGSGFIVNECHLPAYRKAGFNPVAIASRQRENAVRVAQTHSVPKVYDTYEQLLDDPTIEVLDIAVAPNAQFDLIKAACERKTVKAILAQKPLGTDYDEAVEAVHLCEQAGILLGVNQNMRFDQSVRAAKTLMDKGVLGQPVFATIEMRGVPNWMPWQADLGWVTLRTLSIHHLDTFRYWFGDPEGVYCSIRHDPRTGFPHTDGICTYILEYRCGMRCVGIDDPWTGPVKEGCPGDNYLRWRIEGLNGLAIGTVGWCQTPNTTPSTIQYASKADKDFHRPTWTESWFPDGFVGTMAQLLIALENGEEPAISGKDNLKTMALVEAAYLSASQFRSIGLEEIKPPPIIADKPAPKKEGFLQGLFATITPHTTGPYISELFTPRAQQALSLARAKAESLHHNFIGTEHVLLGLIELGTGVAFDVLACCDVDVSRLRSKLIKVIEEEPTGTSSSIPYLPRVKKVFSLAVKEARALNHNVIGTEHLLLGLIREADGVAAGMLASYGLTLEKARAEVRRELAPDFERTESIPAPSPRPETKPVTQA